MSLPGRYIWPNVYLTQWCSSIMHCLKISLLRGYIWPQAKLIQRCSSITCGHKMSLARGYVWPKVSLTQRSGKMSTWPAGWSWGYIWPKVSLTWKSDKNVNLTHSLILGGTSDQRSAWPKDLTKKSTWHEASPKGGPSDWLSAKRTSENFNTLRFMLCFTEVFSKKDQWCYYSTNWQGIEIFRQEEH